MEQMMLIFNCVAWDEVARSINNNLYCPELTPKKERKYTILLFPDILNGALTEQLESEVLLYTCSRSMLHL